MNTGERASLLAGWGSVSKLGLGGQGGRREVLRGGARSWPALEEFELLINAGTFPLLQAYTAEASLKR